MTKNILPSTPSSNFLGFVILTGTLQKALSEFKNVATGNRRLNSEWESELKPNKIILIKYSTQLTISNYPDMKLNQINLNL